MAIADPENETLRRFRDEATRLIPAVEEDPTEDTGTSDTQNKVAGEPTLPNERTHRPGISQAHGLHAREDVAGNSIADCRPEPTGVPSDGDCPNEETTARPTPTAAARNSSNSGIC